MTDKDPILEEAAMRADNIAAMRAMSDLMARLITLLEERTPMFAEIISLLNSQQDIMREWIALVPRTRDHERIPSIHAKLDKILLGTLKDVTEQDRLASDILAKLDLLLERQE